MYDFHKDKRRYFNIQKLVTKEHVIPFLEENGITCTNMNILEIGSAEAGVLAAFVEKGNNCVGIELSPNRVKYACEFHDENIKNGKIRFITKNIHDINIDEDLNGHRFDIIILKDVIEHIFERNKFMNALHGLLNKNGVVFFAFPPWQMPFGGHQQICNNKILKKLPFYHLLPKSIYRLMLQLGKESESTIKELLEIKETQISIGQFHQLCKETSYKIIAKQHYLINPIYEYKFQLKPRKQLEIINYIPYFRNFVTTGTYYIVKEKHSD